VSSMRYTTLGSSGTVVSTQCLGTMTFGAEADEATSIGPGSLLGGPLAAASWLVGRRLGALLADDLDAEALAHP